MRRLLIGMFAASAGMLGLCAVFAVKPTIYTGPDNPVGPWELWFPLLAIFVGSWILYFQSRTKLLRAVSTFLFISGFYSFFFFYTAYGSDCGGVLSILSNLLREHRVEADMEYGAWPNFFLWCGGMGEVVGVSAPLVLKVALVVETLLLSLAFVLFIKETEKGSVFMPALVFVVSCYGFLNWQAAPQTLGMVTLFLFLALLGRSRRVSLLLVLVFVFLTFEHGFVNLWFLAIVTYLIFSRNNLTRTQETKTTTNIGAAGVATMCVIEFAFLVFYARGFFESQLGMLTALIAPSAATGAPLPYTSNRLGRIISLMLSDRSWIGLASRILALWTVLMMVLLIVVGVSKTFRRKELTKTEVSLVVIGGGHALIGSLLPFLGWRGIQLAFLGLSRLPRLALASKKLSLGVLLAIILLLPNNVTRSSIGTSLFLEEKDLVASDWFSESMPTMPEGSVTILCSGETGGLFFSSKCGLAPRVITPRTILTTGESLNRITYFYLSPQYEYEYRVADSNSQVALSELTTAITHDGNLVFDIGSRRVYSTETAPEGVVANPP